MTQQRAEKAPELRWLRRAKLAEVGPKASPRVGVLSGMFNPPTLAHLALAESAADQLALAEVLFVLPEIPPHKEQLEASLEDRAEMLVRSLGSDVRLSAAICTHGLFLDIHRVVQPHYPPETSFFFLTGRDAAERILLHWPYPDIREALAEMFARFDFAVAGRGGEFEVPADSPAAKFRSQIHLLRVPSEYEEIAATLARQRLARGQPVDRLVPAAAAAYIAAHGLYGSEAGGEPGGK